MLESALAFRNLALALAVGLLIGLERGWRLRDQAQGQRVAGVRTFGLLGLLGGVLGTLGTQGHPLVTLIAPGGAVAILAVGYAREAIGSDQLSATTAVAALLTLCLGLLATSGYPALAVAAAAVTTLLLSAREGLHGLLQTLSVKDVRATARFTIIAAAVLPLLPDRDFGPYQAWNPRELWLVVILVTGFSFAGYIAARTLGSARGTIATAAIGGLYSSTAVTAALARRLADPAEPQAALSAGIAVASAMMLCRVLILTVILAPAAAPLLAVLIGPAAGIAILIGARQIRRSAGTRSGTKDDLRGNPFELLPALGFALLVGLLALATRWAAERFGHAGIATLIAITGAFDVDAAIVTLSGLPEGTLAPELASLILSGPVLLNTLFKAGMALVLAGPRRGWHAALPLLVAAAAILATAIIVVLR